MAELAPYACHPNHSRGRLYPEPPCRTRTVYQRDRDRIVHSTAFRRLIHKTQVFLYHEGDHYRTRLTHSLEVSQIARTLARSLNLNEDLVEAIALAHDLGHPPFGHAGEDALNEAMAQAGGFDHNAHTLSIVTVLERRYASFRGLNLAWETLEGIVKHNGPLIGADGEPTGRYAAARLPRAIEAYRAVQDLRLDTQCSLEGQIAALADDIAYNNHDIDDGFRAGFISVRDLEEIPMARETLAAVRRHHGAMADALLVYEMNRRMIASMVEDVLGETRRRVKAAAPSTPDDVRGLAENLAAFSDAMASSIAALRRFLFAKLYQHPAILEKMTRAQGILHTLVHFFLAHPDEMVWEGSEAPGTFGDASAKIRAVGDYVAGMTDMFALKTYAALVERGVVRRPAYPSPEQ